MRTCISFHKLYCQCEINQNFITDFRLTPDGFTSLLMQMSMRHFVALGIGGGGCIEFSI